MLIQMQVEGNKSTLMFEIGFRGAKPPSTIASASFQATTCSATLRRFDQHGVGAMSYH